ncbi:Cu(I)-responsive transcriptional regulator [Pseudaminobacter sp. NGMCC 1.201702]|uniref:Cu(I)-responsive transcriptional regulator n=1 Tax=Pseudaminobacter sp. NGMCC 1.201702 TaxID=3391825 RepID=UPI0039F0D1C6
MNIGEAAAASGVTAKTIRYYEGTGFIPSAARTAAGYRIYSEADVHTLRFIRRARDLGFSTEEIRRLLALWQDRSRASAEVKQLALEHIEAFRLKIAHLQDLRRALLDLAANCNGDHRPDCPILNDLAGQKAAE